MRTLTETTKRINEIERDKAENIKQCKAFVETCDSEIKRLEDELSLLVKSLDTDKIDVAIKILYLRMSNRGYKDLIKLAIDDLLNGCKHMKYEYFGAKDYDGFRNQREDHKYGCGPRHGSTVFALGLNNPQKELTPEEIECCLYYLYNFFIIHDEVGYMTTN